MQEAQIVGGFLFPTDQQASRAVRPRVGSLNYPATGSAASMFAGRGILAFLRNMSRVPASLGSSTHRVRIISFVTTEILFFALCWSWTTNWNALQRFLNQLLVMHIGAGNGYANRHALSVGQHRTLDAELATIGRVFPGFFPRPAAIWSSPRPSSATPSRCLPVRHTLAGPPAIAGGTRPVEPIVESNRGWHSRSQTRAAWPSTDNRFATRTRSRSPRFAATIADARRWGWACTSATTARCVPREHREHSETLTTLARPQTTSVHIGIQAPQSALRSSVVACSVIG